MTKIVRLLVTDLQQTFIIYVVCLTRSPQPLPKRLLH